MNGTGYALKASPSHNIHAVVHRRRRTNQIPLPSTPTGTDCADANQGTGVQSLSKTDLELHKRESLPQMSQATSKPIANAQGYRGEGEARWERGVLLG